MNWLRNFMAGRYGADQLSIALLILSFVLTALSSLLRIQWIGLLSYIPLGLMLFRALSKRYPQRRRENELFLRLWNPIQRLFFQKRAELSDKNHKYFRCRNCKAKLRVPRGKGTLQVTCPKCKHVQKKKS